MNPGQTRGAAELTVYRWAVAAFVLACATSVIGAFGPVVERTVASYDTSGALRQTTEHVSILETQGTSAMVLLSAPPLIGLLPLLIPRRPIRLIAAGLLLLFAILAGYSIGLFYLPAAVTMVLAGLRN